MMSLTGAQLSQLALHVLFAAGGTLSFAVLFACPRRTLPYCAAVGAVGWLVYEFLALQGVEAATAALVACVPLTLLARVFSVALKTPVTVFLLTGIFPLVPGAGIYYTAYYFIQDQNNFAVTRGLETFKFAAAMAIGISVTLGFPLPKKSKRKPVEK